jgi:hypothetical protein
MTTREWVKISTTEVNDDSVKGKVTITRHRILEKERKSHVCRLKKLYYYGT